MAGLGISIPPGGHVKSKSHGQIVQEQGVHWELLIFSPGHPMTSHFHVIVPDLSTHINSPIERGLLHRRSLSNKPKYTEG